MLWRKLPWPECFIPVASFFIWPENDLPKIVGTGCPEIICPCLFGCGIAVRSRNRRKFTYVDRASGYGCFVIAQVNPSKAELVAAEKRHWAGWRKRLGESCHEKHQSVWKLAKKLIVRYWWTPLSWPLGLVSSSASTQTVVFQGRFRQNVFATPL